MFEQFFKSQVAASRMHWQLLESNSIAKPKMSIGGIRSIRQELDL